MPRKKKQSKAFYMVANSLAVLIYTNSTERDGVRVISSQAIRERAKGLVMALRLLNNYDLSDRFYEVIGDRVQGCIRFGYYSGPLNDQWTDIDVEKIVLKGSYDEL